MSKFVIQTPGNTGTNFLTRVILDSSAFEFTPDPNNRWVRLADLVPWAELELLSGYRNHFGSTGNPALPFRVAFGALLVQAGLRLTDEETVEQ